MSQPATDLAAAFGTNDDALAVASPSRAPTDALLEAIYQTALNPARLARLQKQLLVHFREDRSQDETPLTRLALNHIKRALRLGAAHSAMQRERQRVLEVIDAVAPPIIVIDAHRRVMGLNADAEALVASSTLWSIQDGLLCCRETATLASLMARADIDSYASAHVARPSATGGGARMLAYLYRSTAAHNDSAPVAYSLLLIDQPQGIARAIALLGQRMGLTPRETEVIDLSVQGADPDDICRQTGMTLHTLRQHMKNLYAKTGVHNQNALVALVLRNTVLEQAGSSPDARLLPHITGLAHSRVLALPDGRQLGYAEFGAPGGRPVLYFHSLNASRLELLIHADRLRELGVRLIAPDRPGYGHSTFTERQDYAEYTADILSLLDELQLAQVDVLSASAGCAHALHAAAALPGRVRSVQCTAVVPPIGHILASPSPSTLNSMMNQFFRVVPSLLRPAMELLVLGQTVESMLTMVANARKPNNAFSLTEADIAYITAPEHLPYFVASMMESLRQGPRVWAMESVMVNRPWSIDVGRIEVPVHLWHGTRDGLVPTDMVESFARTLPGARLTVLDGDTHLLAFNNIDRLVAAMGPG